MERARPADGAECLRRPGARWRPALLLCAILLVGCQRYTLRDQPTLVSSQIRYAAYLSAPEIAGEPVGGLGLAEGYLAAGIRQERVGLPDCVDLYYRAAVDSWRCLEALPASSADPRNQAAWQVYQESLARLIVAGRRHGRLDPRGYLVVADPAGRQMVPIVYHGFPWKPNEFCEILPAEDFFSRDIKCHYRGAGLGTSLVAVRQSGGREPFYPDRQHFPVTAVLRPARSVSGSTAGAPAESPGRGAVLEFYNPYLFDSLRVGPNVVRMERDLTAPFACLLEDTPRSFTEGFLAPGDSDVKPDLFTMEPYQRGKIPVVFIHGLWSDPATWIDAANTLRSQPDIYRQYQFWYFRYPTGRGLLESAAVLRERLLVARESFDPAHQDGAMDRMVLVGHSMGGLMARLEVSHSSDVLWRHAASRPLEAVRAAPETRERLSRMFFFDPLPMVRRVVFIGTPHRGSTMSRRLIGRLASGLVRSSGSEEAQYRQLMDDNRDIFAEYLWDAWPTSVDLLEPSSPMLQAIESLPLSRCVRTHSIVGTGGMNLGGEPGDGLVPISSARQAGAASELVVPVRHEQLHRDVASVADLGRILREHAQESFTVSSTPPRREGRIMGSSVPSAPNRLVRRDPS
ncbi:MAG: esterase/lipase family protein [Pirellulales bacterium]